MSKNAMHQIWDQIEKQHGKNELSMNIEVITSGSHMLDDALGVWGLPRGRVIQYAGKESSGKTFMSLIAIAKWQSLDPKNWAIFVDAEYTFDELWAAQLGVDIDRTYVIKENNATEIWKRLCGVPNKDPSKPKVKPGFLDLEKENPSGLGIIVLDSVAAMETPVEMSKQAGETTIASLGRFLPLALRKITPLLAQTNVTLIAINQVKVDLGKMWGDPITTGGGFALKHGCSVMVHFTSSEAKKSLIMDDGENVVGHIVGVKIDKNKVAPAHRKCSFSINYTEGVINHHVEIGDLAIKYGVVKRPTNSSYVYGDNKWVGKDNFYKSILDLNLMDELLAKVKEAKLNGQVGADSINEEFETEEE